MTRIVFFTALAVSAMALPSMFLGRHRNGFLHHIHGDVDNIYADDNTLLGEATIDLLIDHFDPKNTATFKNRYFYNKKYSTNDSNVNFLYMAGEGTSSIVTVLPSQPLTDYAKEYHGDIYSIEHRFYGKSRPFNDTSVESLKYLSSRQALEDVVQLINYINNQKKTPQKWIIVGGSYSGAMAAWARLYHPQLIQGAIASSGPFLAQVDFYGYLQVVEKDIKADSEQCYNIVSKGFSEARDLFNSQEGREKLTQTFKIVPELSTLDVITDNDIGTFFSFLTNDFMEGAQYGFPSISSLCKKITEDATMDPLDALAKLISGPIDIRYDESIKEIRDTSYDQQEIANTRAWLYQTCTEFGYFQTTNRGSNIFHDSQPISLFYSYCSDLFDIDPNSIQKNIDATNDYYGGRDYYEGTNVIFTHGTQDPWTYLTKQKNPQHWTVVIAEVEGGTHCSDLSPDIPSIPSRKQIQALTKELIGQWLNGPFHIPDHVAVSDDVGVRPQFSPQYVAIPDEASWSSVPIAAVAQSRPVMPKGDAAQANADRIDRAPERNRTMGWNRFTGKGNHVLLPPPPKPSDSERLIALEFYFTQRWDHFNANDERTFWQKYYINAVYGSVDGPNFLMIGGEGPESIYWAENPKVAWMTYAREVGATVYVLEHRYYGESKLGTNDLQYLTSAQMLYDVAQFITTMNRDRKLTGPWITFGGAYPGALAAWSREWFPELILGAVASSAPVQAKTDFYEYLQVVEKVLNASSQACADRISEAFENIRELTQSPNGRAELSVLFEIYPEWSHNPKDVVHQVNIQDVFSYLIGTFVRVVQYNDLDENKVGKICAIMTDTNRFPDSMKALRAAEEFAYYGKETDTSSDPYREFDYYKDLAKYVDGHDPAEYSDGSLAEVLWLWQLCNEFGFFPTTDYGTGIFGSPVPVNFDILMCEQVFGLSMDHVEYGVARSLYQYGGKAKYYTTNVVLPNGDRDPWHALGIIEQGTLDPSVVPILIEGTSNCYDMYPAKPSDPPQLTQARKDILANIKKWLDSTTTKSVAEVFSFTILTTLMLIFL